MKLFYRTKILISGIFPMKNFKIDGYIQKTGVYNELMMDVNSPDYIFYSAGHFIHSLYSYKGQKENLYEYFENEELFEYEIDDGISKEKFQKDFLHYQINKINLLQKKLRLLTGLGISLPVFITIIYKDNNLYTMIGHTSLETTNLMVNNYDDDMKAKLAHRLCFYISDSTINDLENNNLRFKRALNFYVNSFNSLDIGVRFILLFSSLESLFNIDLENDIISTTISKYTTKILFLSNKVSRDPKKKIINFYNLRSRYIHGDDDFEISREDEKELREIVREVLLIYWNISVVYKITNPQEIKKLLDNIDRDSLNIQVQLFIKYIRTNPSEFKKLYNNVKQNFLNKNYNVLSSVDFDV